MHRLCPHKPPAVQRCANRAAADWPRLPGCQQLQYKDRCRMELIKPAVDWQKSGVKVATMSAAVAK